MALFDFGLREQGGDNRDQPYVGDVFLPFRRARDSSTHIVIGVLQKHGVHDRDVHKLIGWTAVQRQAVAAWSV